jgi:H+/Cl- antiporter ClcA
MEAGAPDGGRPQRGKSWLKPVSLPPTWQRRILFTLGAALVALAALLLAWAADVAVALLGRVAAGRLWVVFLLTPLGLAFCTFLTRTVFPGAQGSGIPQAMASLHMEDPRHINKVLSLRLTFGKLVLTILGLFFGATIGREGPTVQIGASIMNSLGRFEVMRGKEMQRVLVLIGGAAGIAGAFNTPIAGVIFAIEELGHSFDSRYTAALLGAVVVGGVATLIFASHFYAGGYVYFGTVHATMAFGVAYGAVVIAGVVGGLLGGVFGRILARAPEGFPKIIGRFALRRPVLFAGGCGLIVAACNYASGGTTFGSGYAPARALLHGQVTVGYAFAALKYVALTASYLSGIPGGIFSPSLGIGAGLGYWFHGLVPGVSLAAFAMLGMAGYFAGAVQTPITAAVIVMEMTNNQSMLIPVTATALLAYVVSRMICPQPVYGALAEKFLAAIEPANPASHG